MAKADGHIQEAEVTVIFRAAEQGELSEETEDRIRKFREEPPRLSDCLERLGHASDVIRIAVLLQLVEVAWADGIFQQKEREALANASHLLRIPKKFLTPLLTYVRLREREESTIVEVARRELEDLGVPRAALSYFDLGDGRAAILDGLLEKLRERGRTNRFRNMVSELCQSN